MRTVVARRICVGIRLSFTPGAWRQPRERPRSRSTFENAHTSHLQRPAIATKLRASRPALLLLSSLITAFALLGAVLLPAQAQTTSEYFRGIFTTPYSYDPSPVRLRIGKYAYDVPKNTLFSLPENAPQQRAIHLLTLFPEMEGRTPNNKSEIENIGQSSRRITILIDDFSQEPRPITSKEYINNVFDNRVTRVKKQAKIGVQPTEIGLLRHRVTNKVSAQKYDIFVDPREPYSGRTLVIHCRRGGKNWGEVPNPVCSLYFVFGDVSVKANVARRMLPQWRNIRSAIKNWMRRIRVSENRE